MNDERTAEDILEHIDEMYATLISELKRLNMYTGQDKKNNSDNEE